MLEQPSGREVSTPRVTSRKAAWEAFEATMLARYSKARNKIAKTAAKEQLAFEKLIYGEDSKLWMFVHQTRWRRKQIQVEEFKTGVLVWIDFGGDRYNTYLSPTEYAIREEFEFYRKRQKYLIEDAEEQVTARGYGNKYVSHEAIFKEGFYRFEMTPEQIAEDERLKQLEYDEFMARQFQQRQDAWAVEMRQRQYLVNEYISEFKAFLPSEIRQFLLNGPAMFRVLYLIQGYPHIDSLTTEILVATIKAVDHRLLKENAYDIIAMMFGYTDFEAAEQFIADGKFLNLNFKSQ